MTGECAWHWPAVHHNTLFDGFTVYCRVGQACEHRNLSKSDTWFLLVSYSTTIPQSLINVSSIMTHRLRSKGSEIGKQSIMEKRSGSGTRSEKEFRFSV